MSFEQPHVPWTEKTLRMYFLCRCLSWSISQSLVRAGSLLFHHGSSVLILHRLKGRSSRPCLRPGHIEDSLRQDRRESQCKVYFFHYIRSLTPWQSRKLSGHGEYRSLSIYSFPSSSSPIRMKLCNAFLMVLKL